MIIMFSILARRLDSTHFCSCPCTCELHTATKTSRPMAVLRTASHSSSRPSQLVGHVGASSGTM